MISSQRKTRLLRCASMMIESALGAVIKGKPLFMPLRIAQTLGLFFPWAALRPTNKGTPQNPAKQNKNELLESGPQETTSTEVNCHHTQPKSPTTLQTAFNKNNTYKTVTNTQTQHNKLKMIHLKTNKNTRKG
ncbi:hypothetical protein V6Z11_A09G001700 [Gossypium hirsutum]